MAGKLTPKQAIFIAEYLVDGNATRAAIAAGFSAASAMVTGARLRKNRKIAAVIEQRQALQQAKLEQQFDLACQRLADIALADVGKCYGEGKTRLHVTELDDRTRAAVIAVDDETTQTDKDGVITRKQSLKFADPIRATELLGKRLGMFTDKVKHSGKLSLERLVCGDDGEEDQGSGGEQAA